MTNPVPVPIYLGDAVYAHFDGYQIWLETGDGNQQKIALEPAVFSALLKFAEKIWHVNIQIIPIDQRPAR